MSILGRGLSTKITFCVAIELEISFAANMFYFSMNIRKDAFDAVQSKARAVLLQAESSRDYIAALRHNGAFNDSEMKKAFDDKLQGASDKVVAARETAFFKTIPIIAAIKIASEHAAESGFKLRVPKVQARNKNNEANAIEVGLLEKIDKEKLTAQIAARVKKRLASKNLSH